MGIVTKGLLLFNTIRYLKPSQLLNQVVIRFKRKEQFWKYKKEGIKYNNYSLWIEGLDNDSSFMARFSPEKLLNGQLTILNESRPFDKWQFYDASHLWNFNVHYLEYLVPLFSIWKATGEEEYKEKLNEILEEWYNVGSRKNDSNQAYTISLRIVNQLIVSDAVDNKQRLYDSIYAQYHFLLRHQEKHLLGNHYLENLKTIVICSIVFNEAEVYEKFIRKFLKELDEEITDDGLHYELSLMYHKIVLEDLIRVAVILKQTGMREYEAIVKFIGNMCSALYSLEFGIDRTPLFNDAGDNVAKPTNILLETCNNLFGIRPEKKNSVAGYYKLYDNKVAVIADFGGLSPSYMPGHAHCDCLSFELFLDGKPIFVNSGTYQYQGKYRNSFRSTKAHNTVLVNDHEQSELWGEHRAGRRIKLLRTKATECAIEGECRNYYGECHRRAIRLDNHKMYVLDKTEEAAKSILHIAPGLSYFNGTVSGNGIMIKVKPVRANINVEKSRYAANFGKIEENTALVFSWDNDEEEHGYIVDIIEGEVKK